jgi:hypothetical protein
VDTRSVPEEYIEQAKASGRGDPMRCRLMRRAIPLLLPVISSACHQPREMAPQMPLAGIDGKYTFTINTQRVRMEGTFLVAYAQVHLLTPRRCLPIEGLRSSPEMRAAWFECSGANQKRPEPSLRLRFSEIDPLNQSRWYARMRVQDTVTRCTKFNTSGDCTEILRARGMKTVDLNGSITVLRGFPAALDTSRTTDPNGTRPLRVRCDTSATGASCTKSRTGVQP